MAKKAGRTKDGRTTKSLAAGEPMALSQRCQQPRQLLSLRSNAAFADLMLETAGALTVADWGRMATVPRERGMPRYRPSLRLARQNTERGLSLNWSPATNLLQSN
jgi:hypothetical protein